MHMYIYICIILRILTSLAKYAALHPQSVDTSDFWEKWIVVQDKLCYMQWVWFLERMQLQDPRFPALANGYMTCLHPQLPERGTCSGRVVLYPNLQQG